MQELQHPPNARFMSRDLHGRKALRAVSAPRALGKPRLVSLPKLLPLGLIKIFALAILACFASFWVLLHRLTNRDDHKTAKSAPATRVVTTTRAPDEVWVDVDIVESPRQPTTANSNQ